MAQLTPTPMPYSKESRTRIVSRGLTARGLGISTLDCNDAADPRRVPPLHD